MITPLSDDALVLDTPRLRLRPYTPDDVDIARKVLCDPEVTKFVCDPVALERIAAIMPLITRRGAGGRIGMWCAELRATGEKIGDGVLTPIPLESKETDWQKLEPDAYPDDQIEVGYMLKRTAWGQGYASEICARLLRFAFEMTSLDRVVACTDPDNRASQRVLTKCGLKECGTARAYAEEVPFFEITRAAWADDQGASDAPRA